MRYKMMKMINNPKTLVNALTRFDSFLVTGEGLL